MIHSGWTAGAGRDDGTAWFWERGVCKKEREIERGCEG